MSEIIILKGLPASGKSTWAKQFVNDNRNYVRISKDDIRRAFGRWRPKDEKLVVQFRNQLIETALDAGRSVVVDDTNLNPAHIEYITKRWGDEHSVSVENFEVELEEAIERDLARADSVGEAVIRSMHSKWLDERKPFSNPGAAGTCIIVDIDGTLANNDGHRSPYDESKVSDDKRIEPVIQLVRQFFNDYSVIVVSGRSDACRRDTLDWLTDAGVPFDALHMRKAGDTRKDVIIKREIFEEHIGPYYDVLFVVDDRQQTVDGWIDLGLHVLQSYAVNEPRYKGF